MGQATFTFTVCGRMRYTGSYIESEWNTLPGLLLQLIKITIKIIFFDLNVINIILNEYKLILWCLKI